MIQVSVLIRKRGFRYYITHLMWNVSVEQPNIKVDPLKQHHCNPEDFQTFRKHISFINKATNNW